MRSRVGNQILVPTVVLIALAVGLTALLSAYSAARAHNVDRARHLQGIIGTLSVAAFPVNDRVLQQLRGITLAELIVADAQGAVLARTRQLSQTEWSAIRQAAPVLKTIDRLSALPVVPVAGEPHYAVSVPLDDSGLGHRLFVLYPQGAFARDWWWAVGPPLFVGACALLAAALLATRVSRSFTRRLESLRQQVQHLAERNYVERTPNAPRDEFHELQSSLNDLAARLRSLEAEVSRTERLRLLAQLAAGLSHQQRNAIAGARLSVQLHQRDCPAPDESLEIALQQLELTERSIRNILALGQGQRRPSAPGDLAGVIHTAAKLVHPFCRHQQVQLEIGELPPQGEFEVADAEGLQAAVLNLLVNAVEAAGAADRRLAACNHVAAGCRPAAVIRLVRLQAVMMGRQAMIEVRDNGPGFDPDVPPGEPFATSKPYGIGLGLAYGKDVVTGMGGELTWTRDETETCFRIKLPVTSLVKCRTANEPDPCYR